MSYLDASIKAVTKAAAEGDEETLQRLRVEVAPDAWTTLACQFAALNGHLQVLQWLRAQVPPCPWDEWTCRNAVVNGHWDMLQWLVEHGAPWDEDTCEMAAKYNRLEILQRLKTHGCPWNLKTICDYCVDDGWWPMLQWVLTHAPPSYRPWIIPYWRFFRNQYYEAYVGLQTSHDLHVPCLAPWVNAVREVSTTVLEALLCSDLVRLVQSYC